MSASIFMFYISIPLPKKKKIQLCMYLRMSNIGLNKSEVKYWTIINQMSIKYLSHQLILRDLSSWVWILLPCCLKKFHGEEIFSIGVGSAKCLARKLIFIFLNNDDMRHMLDYCCILSNFIVNEGSYCIFEH